MTVVINEFEVVPETVTPPSTSSSAEPQQPPSPSVPEIERLVDHLAERAMRVWAH